MSERFISDADIIEVANNLSSIKKQEKNDTYLLKGKSCWGEKLGLSVAVRENVIIVTVFHEGDK